jgi:hypothetical protein
MARTGIKETCRDTSGFKKGYWPSNNLVKTEKGDRLADPHSNFNRLKDFFCKLLHVHGVNYARQTEIHTAEPLVPKPSVWEDDADIKKN